MINPFVDTLSNAILIVFLAFILVVALGITVMALLFFISMIKDWLEDLWT